MLHNRFVIPVVVLFALSTALPRWAQNRSGGAYAAAVPTPGQPTAPAVPAPAPPAVQPPGALRPPTPGAQAQKPEDQTRIVADPATNSLVIYGTAQEFQNIKNILKDLDIVPRQVLLDVLIAEVTLQNTESFGIEYEIFSKFNPTIFGEKFGSQGAVRSGSLPPASAAGLTQFASGISGVIGRGNAIRAFINALAKDSRLKILSSPSVLAADNRPARIQVGSQEPVATGTVQSPQATGTIVSSSTIQYQNTGMIVTIIPQVNSQGLVNLQILAEVSQINPDASVTLGSSGSFPSFDIRQAETTAVVQDGDSLVIGGIIADNRSRARTGIPYLMDLPVLGRFFGTTTDKVDRTELIMLITPHVIRNREQGQQITEDFKKSLSTVRNELDRMAREREKLQKQPLEQKPTLPGPSGDVAPPPNPVAPAPSAAPAGQQGVVAPPHKISLPSTVSPPSEMGTRVLTQPVVSPPSDRVLSAQPAYVLSVTRPFEPARPSPPRLITAPRPASKPARQCAVQVASLAGLAGEKDAQKMADFLRKSGYEAYVMIFETESKTWHRVRIGRFIDLRAANELKDSLSNATQFKQAYVAAN